MHFVAAHLLPWTDVYHMRHYLSERIGDEGDINNDIMVRVVATTMMAALVIFVKRGINEHSRGFRSNHNCWAWYEHPHFGCRYTEHHFHLGRGAKGRR